jgi:hypothetical protein
MDAVEPRIFWTPGSTTYTEAKKLARQHFTSQAPNVGGGWHRVWVCT